MPFYPKTIQKLMLKRQKTTGIASADKILQGLKPPIGRHKQVKAVEKMSQLALCQINFMQVLLQKIDRKSKPIKKQERQVDRNLRRKRIFLENEHFDIMKILQQSIAERTSPKKSKRISPQKAVPLDLFDDTRMQESEERKLIDVKKVSQR
jgi:hypothetical protein